MAPGDGSDTGGGLLALVRHGETEANAKGLWLGLRDSPLTEMGREQALVLGERLKREGPWAAIATSPLGRAVETALLVAGAVGAPVLAPDHDLREYDFGEWDGLAPAELRARGLWAAVKHDAEFAPPGGEGFAAAARRLSAALKRIASTHPAQRVIVVTHGLALAAGLALNLTGDARNAAEYALPNGGLAVLRMESEARLLALDGPMSCDIGD